jgi:hypothetical protein
MAITRRLSALLETQVILPHQREAQTAAFLISAQPTCKLTRYQSEQRPGRGGLRFAMQQTASEVEFSLAPQRLGSVWIWIATHPSGQQEEIVGFHSEAEAQEWRTSNGLRAWFRTRGCRVEGTG